MLKFSIPQLLSLNHSNAPTCTSVIKQLGLLRRHHYIHRSQRRRQTVYSQHGDAEIPSIHSVCRRVAHLTRHQSPVTAGSNRARNIARPLHEYTESIARPPHTKESGKLSTQQSQIRFRNLRNINPDIMTLDLQHISSANFSSVNESVAYYNQSLNSLLDLHPPQNQDGHLLALSPWYTASCGE
ncbi:hypothetical protein F7725_007565 [Dissostichus mawsoni]|uniref:Uncharacterized protein n=1 Tax=Dissostichus mawsoni TaxID=36200 RepID=A0A7J5Y4S4_DISMA|nr:hypothetical protein F7725_007565 [Dissostichus mawsoni]